MDLLWKIHTICVPKNPYGFNLFSEQKSAKSNTILVLGYFIKGDKNMGGYNMEMGNISV